MATRKKIRARKGPSRGPRRTCAACRQEDAPEEMIRWVRDDAGAVFPDLAGRSFGRGAWVHPRASCLQPLRNSLARSFKAEIATANEEAWALLAEAAQHRILQLLGAARRQNLLVFGADATADEYNRDELGLLLVAQDARAAADSGYVADAVRKGQAASWGTKQQLGQLFGRAEVGVLGVRDRGLARSLFGAIALALLVQNEPFRPAKARKIIE